MWPFPQAKLPRELVNVFLKLSGLKNANAAFFERKGPERKPWPQEKPLKAKNNRNAFFER